ncbi:MULTISPECIES: 3-sulfinopropanoyl-CoA desulfinase [unclassified Ruegeria]|uniref:3-sulfinopropanoyl-CoA desulfinase n=1 Tax=unclassified Ruegeria TaxID=2625375 RepID=UPI001487BECC|nr:MULTISPECIES: 3-sulfinopropanoyl-CoA desulfinase [unclassified Ruegeria]NOD89773.1 acyl-CoA dehydrogenase [Ruegeria sp. HKCCD4318]NOD94465.1 acyl-CoA dehydrogenase [Ruegeria sp. HKCCD4884]NOE14781.1 acyl-CoA dehydrogenase [Ruegeria sp. HKCCD4318-2]NOG10866.1 acyl-CoA dehydrogenase [Ruegeria sp. HKCCD4315]
MIHDAIHPRGPCFELSDRQRDLQAKARQIACTVAGPLATETDRTEQYPTQVVQALTEAGFMGMGVPKALGGPGRSCFDVALVVEELSAACGVSGRIAVEGNMGAVGAIIAYGTQQQKQSAASHVLRGDKPAICITEPEAGSAATDMTSTAVRDGDAWVLNGKKHWITGGGISQLHLIFARVIDDGVFKGIGGFMAYLGEDGLKIGAREPTLGLRGIPETEVILDNLRLPMDRLITPPEGLEHGFAGLMNAYNAQRVGAATVALGIARGAYEVAVDFVKKRQQFGRPIAEFQGLQWMIADMSMQIDAARMMIWRAAASAETQTSGFPDPMLAAQAKVFASEMAVKVTNDALQLHGARGYSRNAPVERMLRDARMFTIGGGTAQMLRNLVAGKALNMKTPQTRGGYLSKSGEE